MIYLKSLVLPTDEQEYDVILREKRSFHNSVYPFKIFPQKDLSRIEFDNITMFCGGNGSGKSTLINILGQILCAERCSKFNDSPFFDRFADLCTVKFVRTAERSRVLTSDDVFDYALSARFVNEQLDHRRDELLQKYIAVHRDFHNNGDMKRLKSLDDYERWSETMDILSPRHSQASLIRNRVVQNVDLYSNGQTAMHYFMERIEEDGIYLLDEPENSLSVEYQLQLADFIEATARSTRSQFIIATHSPIFLAMHGARIYNLDDDPASVCTWTELPNVRKFYDFFMDHRHEF